MSPVTYSITIGLLLCCVEIHSQPIHLFLEHVNNKRESRHHPFPEMSRFLNSHSRIHRQSSKPLYSFLEYLCSVAHDEKKIEDILDTFGRHYGSLIMTIIENDCPVYDRRSKQQPSRRAIQENITQTFSHDLADYYHKL